MAERMRVTSFMAVDAPESRPDREAHPPDGALVQSDDQGTHGPKARIHVISWRVTDIACRAPGGNPTTLGEPAGSRCPLEVGNGYERIASRPISRSPAAVGPGDGQNSRTCRKKRLCS